MTHVRLILVALFAVLGLSSVRAGDWPQWLGPKRDGASNEKVTPWKVAPKVLWRQPLGEGFSCPVVADGRVFVHARVPGKDEEELIAFDATTGKVVWRTAYERGPYVSLINTGPQGTPCVVGKRVYTYGITGILSCFEAETGKRVWNVEVYKKLGVPRPRFGVCCSPLVVGNRVLVSCGGKGSAVAAFDTDKGEVAWKALDGPVSTGSPITYLNKTRRGMANLEAVFINGRSLVALEPFEGGVSWEFPLSDQSLGTAPSPVASGDLLLASTNKLGGVAVKLSVEEGKTKGTRVWGNEDLSGYFSTPVICEKHIYMVTTTLLPQPASTLRCVDVDTGKEAWSEPKAGIFFGGLVRTGDKRLLLLNDRGELRLVEHDPKGYRELARATVCGATFVGPALSNGRLYVRDRKELICLQLNP